MSEDLSDSIEFEVRGFDCGYGGSLRAFALANFLQEAAGANAARLGFGMGELNSGGRTWMLSRLDLRVDALPAEGERVAVRTWPAGAKRLFAMRAIEMRGAEGRSLVRAVYAYLIVDVAARRPLRPQSVFGSEFPGEGLALPVADYSFDIPEANGAQLSFAQRVCRRHIDNNGHANNAHIVNWLVDAASPGAGPGPGALGSLRVEFSAEALEGDELAATRGALVKAEPGRAAAAVTELRRGEVKVARALVGLR